MVINRLNFHEIYYFDYLLRSSGNFENDWDSWTNSEFSLESISTIPSCHDTNSMWKMERLNFIPSSGSSNMCRWYLELIIFLWRFGRILSWIKDFPLPASIKSYFREAMYNNLLDWYVKPIKSGYEIQLDLRCFRLKYLFQMNHTNFPRIIIIIIQLFRVILGLRILKN